LGLVQMFKEEVTQNIYASWYELVKNKGKGSNLKTIKSLEAFTADELEQIRWLVNEEFAARSKKKLT